MLRGAVGSVLPVAICLVVSACGDNPGPNSDVGGNSQESDAYASGAGALSSEKRDILDRINAIRSEARTCGSERFSPTDEVAWSNALERAAQRHSDDMEREGFVGHTGSDGSRPRQRVADTGYDYATVGENAGGGRVFQEFDTIMEAWLGSPGHCANIMNQLYSEVGVARAGGYWTMVFADPL